jgi:hypothetical protein
MDEIQHKYTVDGISVNDEVAPISIVFQINHLSMPRKQAVAR